MSHDDIKIFKQNQKKRQEDQKTSLKEKNQPHKRPGATKEDKFKMNVKYENMNFFYLMKNCTSNIFEISKEALRSFFCKIKKSCLIILEN